MRLSTRSDYQRMTHGSQRFIGRWIIVDIKSSNYPSSRLGITVTRRFGKAHDRNRFKRITREAFRLSQFSKNINILVRPRSYAHEATMGDVQAEILAFVQAFQKKH
jgi:ribonuclease P protein component